MERKILVALVGRKVQQEVQNFIREHGSITKAMDNTPDKEEARIFLLDIIIEAVELLKKK